MSSDRHLQPHLFHEVRTDDPEGPYQYVTPTGLDLERDPSGYAHSRAKGFEIEDTATSGVHVLRTADRYIDRESQDMRLPISPKPGSPEATWHANQYLNSQALFGEVGATAQTDQTRGTAPVPFNPADLASRDERGYRGNVTVFHDRRDPDRVLGKVGWTESEYGGQKRTEVGNAVMDPAFRGQGLSQAAAEKWLEGRGEVSTSDFSAAGQAAFSRHGVRSRGGISGQGRR